ncbi:MAG: bifunctional folylpolyglutamate synthase/dihydrofolate synthase [Candidatus Saganbacteria bacterium]|nr:bifunctional folylpolyglutamate synthase/dihydrofolate synthase [Candidatus Saganbacteria bacterium]
MHYKTYLSSFEKFGMRLGLERIHYLLERLDHPEKAFDSILIAGTNGKGSVVAMLASILKEAGLPAGQAGIKVGQYTSPHLFDYTERIKVNGKDIKPKDLDRLMLLVSKVVEEMEDQPTVFEVLTAAALLYFKEQKVQVALLEVGLGGRFDATNAVTPVLSVITQIAYDHTEVLGKKLEQIAFEKAGIIKDGVEVVVGDAPKGALKIIVKTAKTKHAKILCAKTGQVKFLSQQLEGQKVKVGKDVFFLPLVGRHQLSNLAIVLKVIERLNELENRRLNASVSKRYIGDNMETATFSRRFPLRCDNRAIKKGLQNTNWPLRFQLLSKRPLIILDAAHNVSGAKALVDTLKESRFKKPIVFYVGILKRKDYKGILKEFARVADKFLVTTFNYPEASSVKELLTAIKKETKVPAEHLLLKDAKRVLLGKYKHAVICVAGSIYFGAEFVKMWRLTVRGSYCKIRV